MEGFLTRLGVMSFQAGVIILVVCLLRMILVRCRISQKHIILLWMVPFFFMVFPWKVSSPIGFWREYTVIEQAESDRGFEKDVVQESVPTENVTYDKTLNQGLFEDGVMSDASGENTQQTTDRDEPTYETQDSIMQGNVVPDRTAQDRVVRGTLVQVVFSVWLAGVVSVYGYILVSILRLKKQLACSVCEEGSIYLAEDIRVPMVFGIIRPRIYIPTGMEEVHKHFVVAHEQTHIMRRDSIKKLLAFGILGVHWFNPLAWVAFLLLERDMEMACDEETVERLGENTKQAYAETLLQISVDRRMGNHRLSVPLGFGEADIKQRIKNILVNKRTLQVVTAFVIVLCVVLTAIFLTKQDRGEEYAPDASEQERSEEDVNLLVEQPIESVRSSIPADMVYTVDGPDLLYADAKRLLFRDGYALFVYDFETGKMLRQIDVTAIGSNDTRGDSYCEAKVSEDGTLVYLHPISSESMYVYDTEKDNLVKTAYAEPEKLWNGLLNRSDYIEEDYTVYQSLYCVEVSKGTYGYLHGASGMVVDTVWIVRDAEGKESLTYLFRENKGEQERQPEETEPGPSFTMEVLIELVEEGKVYDNFQQLVWRNRPVYENFVKESLEYSLNWSYSCNMTYKDKDYRLQVSYWKPEEAGKYGKTADALNTIYLTEITSGDMMLLYDGDGRYKENTDIEEFLGRTYDISNYLTCALPEGTTLGNYKIYGNDIFSGCILQGDYAEIPHGDGAPESWYAPGGVGIADREYYPLLRFENGKLESVTWRMNHSYMENGEVVEDCDMQAMLYEMGFDTFTMAQWEEYKTKYPEVSEELSVSKYWYVFFGEPDSERIYTIYFSQNYFTKEEVIAMAKSVRFNEKRATH